MNDLETPNTDPSRREFVIAGGTAVAATALTGVMPMEALGGAPAVAAVGPAAVRISLNVNGRDMPTTVEPRVTLLDALRNYLDVTGCKRVCDRGTCGACTVMLDGKPVYSCTMLAVEAQGKTIRTAESLVDGEQARRVPAAFVTARRPAVRLLHAGLRRGHEGGARSQSPRPRPPRSRRACPATSAAAAPTNRCATPSPPCAHPRGGTNHAMASQRRLIGTRSSPRSTAPTRRPGARSTASTSTGRACCTPGSCVRRMPMRRIKSIDTAPAEKIARLPRGPPASNRRGRNCSSPATRSSPSPPTPRNMPTTACAPSRSSTRCCRIM